MNPLWLAWIFSVKLFTINNAMQAKNVFFNALQTNGILLNNEWCAFLKEHEFLVGISIDGPGSYMTVTDAVIQATVLLQK